MFHRIEASFALIHTLKNRESCTIGDLVKTHMLIEQKMINKEIPTIYIDVTKVSILHTIACFPDVFEWEDEKIHRKAEDSDYFKAPYINYFNFGVKEELASKIAKMFEDGWL